MIERHFLEFIDKDRQIHDVQVPVRFDRDAHIDGVTELGGKYVLRYHLPDGTEPMIAMPEDYAPDKGWLGAGYRREEAG